MNGRTEKLKEWGPTVARVALSIVFFAHGAQKMWGWFDGPGLSNWLNFLAAGGTPKFLAFMDAFVEFFAAVALFFGFLTRLSALGIFCVMIVAIFKVHWSSGFFLNWTIQAGMGHGFEYSLTLLLVAISLMLSGGGNWSLDNLIWKKKPAAI